MEDGHWPSQKRKNSENCLLIGRGDNLFLFFLLEKKNFFLDDGGDNMNDNGGDGGDNMNFQFLLSDVTFLNWIGMDALWSKIGSF